MISIENRSLTLCLLVSYILGLRGDFQMWFLKHIYFFNIIGLDSTKVTGPDKIRVVLKNLSAISKIGKIVSPSPEREMLPRSMEGVSCRLNLQEPR